MKSKFDELVELMGFMRSPDGCAWDREQTIDSFKKHFTNEVKELVKAIENNDSENLKEELGDLLWNVIFISQIAKEEKFFTIDDVIRELLEKIVRRHPHVFGGVKAETLEEVLECYHEAKREEKSKKRESKKQARV